LGSLTAAASAPFRNLTSIRQVHGDLKLCNVPEHVRKVLEQSQLTKLFDSPELTSSAATHNGFQAACAKAPVVELGSDFSSCNAGEACGGLLEKIEARLNPKIA
jgi:hypothetical protein